MTYQNRIEALALDYPDNGCAIGGSSCLACERPKCAHDEPTVRVARLGNRRARIQARVAEGATVEDVMREFGVGRRTARRDAYGAS